MKEMKVTPGGKPNKFLFGLSVSILHQLQTSYATSIWRWSLLQTEFRVIRVVING